MAKESVGASGIMYPNPVVLVTSGQGNDANIVTLAWAGTVCSAPWMISISVRPGRHSHGLIMRNGEFVLNIPTVAQLDAVKICGTQSGRDVNKWTQSQLHPDNSIVIKTPGIAECPVSLECRVHHTLNLGVHTLFVAEVVHKRQDPNWKCDPSPLTFMDGKYFAVDGKPLI